MADMVCSLFSFFLLRRSRAMIFFWRSMRSCSQTSLSSGRASEARRSWASCSRLKLPNHSSNWSIAFLKRAFFWSSTLPLMNLLAEFVVIFCKLLLHLPIWSGLTDIARSASSGSALKASSSVRALMSR
jgi:hypothetical protein